jgi:hypothetical protein
LSTKGQVLVAVVLAGMVVGVFIQDSGAADDEPMLVTQARIRQSRASGGSSGRVLEQARRLGRALTGDGQYADGIEPADGDEANDAEDQLNGLPIVQLLGLMSGGEIGPFGDERAGAGFSGEYEDWEFLEKADSAFRSPRIQQLLKTALGTDLSRLGRGP